MSPCVAKTCAERPGFARPEGSWGQQIQEFAEAAMKQTLVRGHNLRLLDEAREVGHQQHPGPENQDGQHILDQPRQGSPGSVRFGYGLGMERFERFQFSVPAVPLRSGFCVFQYSLTERTVPVPVSVPGKRFRRFRFRVRFLGKRFRRFRFPVPVRFLGHPAQGVSPGNLAPKSHV